MTKTLTQMRTDVKTYCNLDSSEDATSTQLNSWLNASLGTLRDMLIQHDPDRFIASAAHSISTVADTSTYDLASDHYHILGVDLTQSGTVYTVEPHSFRERNRWQVEVFRMVRDDAAPFFRYIDLGDQIRFTPTPTAVYTVSVHYIPVHTTLSSDSDTTDANIENQWLDWAVLDVAIKYRIRRQESIQELVAMQDKIEKKIQDAADRRILSQRHRAVRTRTRSWF